MIKISYSPMIKKYSLVFIAFICFVVSGYGQVDDFTDGDFTSNPTWVGNTSDFSILADATLPGGSASTDQSFLGSDSSTGSVTLMTTSTEVNEWQFSLGSPDFNPSSSNYFGVILMSNVAVTGGINDTSWNGYFLKIGTNGSGDEIELWEKNGAGTGNIVGDFPTSPVLGTGALRDGLNIRITRSAAGEFELFYSTGFTYTATPTTSAGTLTDNTTSISSYFGIYSVFGNTGSSRRVFIDNIALNSCSISNIALTNIGSCNDNGTPAISDDYYTADVIVTYTNAVGSNINLSGSGVLGGTTSAPISTSPQTITGVQLAANGSELEITATFDSTSCTYTDSTVNGSDVSSCSSGGSTCSDLFISEYVEGSASNKYIEIYNPTASDIDLTPYSLVLYANGSATPTNTNALSGTISAYGTVVYRNSGATIYSGTTITSSVTNFNGDDAVALLNGTDYIDIIGRIGEDPGSAWTATGYSTENRTLRRKATVLNGISTNPSSGFPTLDTEWDAFAIDNISDLGMHTSDCQVTITPKYFRSKNAGPGNWANTNSWEFSDDNSVWTDATFAPTQDANTITIRTGHTILVNTPISLDQTIINGTLELLSGSTLTINDGTGDDILVNSGGSIEVKNNSGDYATIFLPDTNASIHVSSNAKITITGGISAVPGNMGNLAASTDNIWDNNSIFEWNSSVGTPDGSGITYFPNANTSTIPIFRISSLFTGDDTIGGGFPLIVNGLIDARTDVTFKNSGLKTFRDGINGDNVTVTFLNNLGTLTIEDSNAVLSGNLNLEINKQLNLTNGVTIPSGSLVTVTNSSSSTIDKQNGIFNVETNAIFDIGTECSISNTSGSVNISGAFRTGNDDGFSGTGSSLPSAGNIINLNPNCTVELNRNDGTSQSLLARSDFKNLTFSGSGTKTISSGFDPEGLVYITNSAILDVSNSEFGNASTSLTMDETSRFRLSGVGSKPDIGGSYDLQDGVIEFYNSGTAQLQTIKGTAINYNAIEVTGNRVGNGAANITLKDGGIFTVKPSGIFEINIDAIVGPSGSQTVTIENGGVFKTGDEHGFNGGSGSTTTSVRNDIENIILEIGSTVEYSRVGDQSITEFLPNYANVNITGSGTKTILPTVDGISIGENLNVLSSTLRLDDEKYIEVIDDVIVDGTLIIEEKANFVQRGSGLSGSGTSGTFTNNGTSLVNKTTSDFNDSNLHYTYWSSPVINANPFNLFPNADSERRYYYKAANFEDIQVETGNNNDTAPGHDDIDDNGDDWQEIENLTNPNLMIPGRGFAITATAPPTVPNPFPYNNSVAFSGAFNTGDVSITIEYNGNNGDNDWNFVGNPYPGAISFTDLYNDNNSVIDGCAFLWSHASIPLDSNNGNEVFNFNQDDYAIINLTGCTAGGSQVIPDPYIPSGQGFFVKGLSNGVLTFTNGVRIADASSNSQFFSPNNSTPLIDENNNLETNKIWLNLHSDTNVFNQILIGYINGATNDFDGFSFDAPRNLSTTNPSNIYTMISGDERDFAIQGKAINSLSIDEVIPVGFKTSIEAATIYTFSIPQLEGAFLNETPIYIKDNLLGIYHDLKESDYNFTSDVGEFNDRFEIVFNQEQLSLGENELNTNTLTIIEHNSGKVEFKVSSKLQIKTIEIIDITGRSVYNFNVTEGASTVYNLSALSQAAYIAKVELTDGRIITKKALKQK